MLVQFNFSNFRSFRDENTLDMTAASISEHPEHLIHKNKNEKFLKIAAIYGANASGKSNIMEAMNYMQYIISSSFSKTNEKEWDEEKEEDILTETFKFNEKSKNGDSLFEVFFIVNDIEYQYGFKLNNKEIVEEWLYERHIKNNNENLIFSRIKMDFTLNENLENYRNIIDSIKKKTLILSLLSNLNILEINNVYNWFKSTKVLDFGDSIEEFFRSKRLPIPNLKDQRFKRFLKNIDVGIEDIKIEEVLINEKESGNEKKGYKIFTIHSNNDNGKKEELPLAEESQGTIKMIALYKNLTEALDEGRTLFIDELEAKLHPLLVKYIIKLFTNKNSNPKNAQLIFTTHDVINLRKENFRRDEIWFVEKNNKEKTSLLFSLVEFKDSDGVKVRKDASFGKNYLYGIYGAIPNLEENETIKGEQNNG